MAVFILQLVKRQNVAILCKLALTVNFLACCFTFQTLGLVRQNYQVWLAIFFLIGRTNNFAPECLALLFLVGNCLAKPGVWNVKQQVKLLTVNASLQMVVLSLDTFRCAFALGKWSLHSRWNLIPACVCLSKKKIQWNVKTHSTFFGFWAIFVLKSTKWASKRNLRFPCMPNDRLIQQLHCSRWAEVVAESDELLVLISIPQLIRWNPVPISVNSHQTRHTWQERQEMCCAHDL